MPPDLRRLLRGLVLAPLVLLILVPVTGLVAGLGSGFLAPAMALRAFFSAWRAALVVTGIGYAMTLVFVAPLALWLRKVNRLTLPRLLVVGAVAGTIPVVVTDVLTGIAPGFVPVLLIGAVLFGTVTAGTLWLIGVRHRTAVSAPSIGHVS